MDLEKIIKDFIYGSTLIEDMIQITGFSYNSLIRIINNYCNKNDVNIEEIQSKLNKTYNNMYKMKCMDLSYDEIAKKYNSKPSIIKSLIDRFCACNNINIPEKTKYKRVDNNLNLPSEEIYKLKKTGLSYRKISEKYNCSWKAIKTILIKYCDENNIDVNKEFKNVNLSMNKIDNNFSKKALNLPVEELYKLKNGGMTYKEIAEKYNCSFSTVRYLLVKYCDKNNVNLPIKLNCNKLNLDASAIYDLKKSGMSYSQIAMMYGCTATTIRTILIKYSSEKGIKIPPTINSKEYFLPIKEVYDLKMSGMSYDKIANIYECSYYIINKKLKEYFLQKLLLDFDLIMEKDNKKIIYKDELESALKNEKSLV